MSRRQHCLFSAAEQSLASLSTHGAGRSPPCSGCFSAGLSPQPHLLPFGAVTAQVPSPGLAHAWGLQPAEPPCHQAQLPTSFRHFWVLSPVVSALQLQKKPGIPCTNAGTGSGGQQPQRSSACPRWSSRDMWFVTAGLCPLPPHWCSAFQGDFPLLLW